MSTLKSKLENNYKKNGGMAELDRIHVISNENFKFMVVPLFLKFCKKRSQTTRKKG